MSVVTAKKVRVFASIGFWMKAAAGNSNPRREQDVRSIDVDEEVWTALQAQAEPFTDTPNTVLRRVLHLPFVGGQRDVTSPRYRRSDGTPDRNPALTSEGGSRTRAPVGSLLPESAYELPILRVLSERGGSAPARDVVSAVGELVAERLTKRDQEQLPNGGLRWQSRVQFTRLRLKERGLIQSGSPRGLWELSEAGAEELAKRNGDG